MELIIEIIDMRSNLNILPTLQSAAGTAVEDARTDPLALITVAASGPLFVEALQELPASPSYATFLGLSACAMAGAGVYHARRNFRLKSRLEEALARYGWDERVFKDSIKEWCGRQVGRVVCDHAGLSEQYRLLEDSTRGEQEFSWFPNI